MTDKNYLAEVIYKINEKNAFHIQTKAWSMPTPGFAFDKSRIIKIMDNLMQKGFIREKRSDVICILADWSEIAEGIFFTHKAIYVNTPKNKPKSFNVRYDEIEELKYDKSEPKLTIKNKYGEEFDITTVLWSKRNIKTFLEIASERMKLDAEDKKRISHIEIIKKKQQINKEIAGVTFGNVSNASTNYSMDKFSTPRGHGFAAENANHLNDKLHGRKATLVGDEIDPTTGRIVKNGADRIVEGVSIQTKYCKTGAKCISECFEDGRFRYINSDGSPMQIEVPSDKYDAAVKAMENRIRKGQVKGITNPNEAKNIVRKGRFTYEQVKNIAKAGTVESLAYDAVNGVIISTATFGISAVLTFATNIWNGQDIKSSLKEATYVGLKVGGTTFITAVLSSQLAKAGMNSALVGSSEAIVSLIGPKASAVLANAFRSGSNIYGSAAMKSAAKMLRSNVITATISVVVLSSADILNIFRGRISSAQLLKNITNTVATVGGGGAGWISGAAAGSALGSVIPIVGTAVGATIGGIAGSLAGGSVANKVSSKITDQFVRDDAKDMLDIIEKEFVKVAEDYLLKEGEADFIIRQLQKVLDSSKLKDMYASSNRKKFAKNLFIKDVEKIVKKRKFIKLPSDQQMKESIKGVLEEIADKEIS